MPAGNAAIRLRAFIEEPRCGSSTESTFLEMHNVLSPTRPDKTTAATTLCRGLPGVSYNSAVMKIPSTDCARQLFVVNSTAAISRLFPHLGYQRLCCARGITDNWARGTHLARNGILVNAASSILLRPGYLQMSISRRAAALVVLP